MLYENAWSIYYRLATALAKDEQCKPPLFLINKVASNADFKFMGEFCTS